MAFVTIYTTFETTEAHLLKSHLLNSGFEVLLKDDLYGSAVTIETGGVKVQVFEEEAKEAYQFLLDNEFIVIEKVHESIFTSITKNIPFVKDWDIVGKILFLFISVFILLAVFVYFSIGFNII